MEIEPIGEVSAIAATDVASAVAHVVASVQVEAAPRSAAASTNAHVCTGFDPQACRPDLHGQGIAAAAAAQDHRVFVRRRTSA